MRTNLVRLPLLGVALATALTTAACSGGPASSVESTAAAVDAVNAAGANLGSPIASLPASAPGVSTWNVYASVGDDGSSTLTVLGVDGNGALVAGAVLLPDQNVAGVGTSGDASQAQAQAIGASIAADVNGYIGAGTSDTSSMSVHTLGNPFGLSDCTFAVLSAIGSIAGTVSGTVGAFSTCPVTVGVGCVAGVVMTVAGAAVGVYNVNKAIQTCSGPTPTVACQTACNNIGTTLPACMTEQVFSSCYQDCTTGSGDALTSFASCVQDGLSASSSGSDPGDADGGADPCQPLAGCFDVF